MICIFFMLAMRSYISSILVLIQNQSMWKYLEVYSDQQFELQTNYISKCDHPCHRRLELSRVCLTCYKKAPHKNPAVFQNQLDNKCRPLRDNTGGGAWPKFTSVISKHQLYNIYMIYYMISIFTRLQLPLCGLS